jgi:arylsulfatase A-like enzyme
LNVVFILADDLGWRDLGCYGRPDYATPVLDALAARGVRFTQAYANSSSCSPTRVALATGRYQQRLPVGLLDPLPPGSRIGLPPGHATLAGELSARGFRTALVGKWHMGEGEGQGPLHHGYDEFFGFLGGAMTYFSHLSGPPGTPASAPALREGKTPLDQPGYATDLFADRAVEFVRRADPRPFFLSLHFNAPHWPWEGPGDAARAASLREMWHFEGGSLAVYGAMVEAMDAAIGRVLAAIEERGRSQDTLVIFTSDNGGERYSYHWPLRGEKGALWEGGIRVPAIVAGPRVAAGHTTDEVAMTMDWMPTILAAARVAANPAFAFDGIDLGPALADAAPLPQRTLYWRTQDMSAARRGPWKYVRSGAAAFLLNLDEDVTENANGRFRHPEVFATLERNYREWETGMLPIPDSARRARWEELVLRKRSLADREP